MSDKTPNVVVIGGPTASGKSALALGLAVRRNGVVINADSMQVYDGLPLLTAQPGHEDLSAAPHALYGVLGPRDICSAARWRDMALHEIAKAHNAGKLPIVVGGTGFYLRALLAGFSPIPEIAPEIRAAAAKKQKELGNPAFHAELAKRDPATAARLDPFNTQRNVRAWEVLEGTGRGMAAWHETPPEGPPAHLRFLTVTLIPPRAELVRRCDKRFQGMIAAGALEEARHFDQVWGGDETLPLVKALGYRELRAHLRGEMGLEEAVKKACGTTRDYAKRQSTWFRNQTKADLALEAPDVAAVENRLHESYN